MSEQIWGKLHFTTLNYALYYTFHHKLSDCTLYTLKYHTYHALHPDVIFDVIFNRIMLHVISICFLLRWNKVERLKHPSSSLPHSFSNFSLWSENMTQKIKENLTAFMTEFSSFETWTLSFQIINEPYGFNWDGFFLGNRDEGIRDPFPEGWLTLRLLICICWNERLSQFFFFFRLSLP